MPLAITTLAIALAAFGFANGAGAQQITGAGATFPTPIYTKWGQLAKSAISIELNYQAIGSGGGKTRS